MPVAHLLPVEGTIVVLSPNWLGDCIMSMPAVETLRANLDGARIVILARPWLADLWSMSESVNEVIAVNTSGWGFLKAARSLRRIRPAGAVIFPNSFRSALIAYLAGIPIRIGTKGHCRVWMLTDVVSGHGRGYVRHQAVEYLEIVGSGDTHLSPPRLVIPDEARRSIEKRFPEFGGGVWVAVFPGAARGPSKRWPPEYFAEAIRRICGSVAARAVVLGSASERSICGVVSELAAPYCLNLSGELSLCELAALLSACRLTLCNDSGGMHLSAAVGTPTVAVFGITDPAVTGPLGQGHRILAAPNVRRSRFIGRTSRMAGRVLAAITPEMAAAAALEVLRG